MTREQKLCSGYCHDSQIEHDLDRCKAALEKIAKYTCCIEGGKQHEVYAIKEIAREALAETVCPCHCHVCPRDGSCKDEPYLCGCTTCEPNSHALAEPEEQNDCPEHGNTDKTKEDFWKRPLTAHWGCKCPKPTQEPEEKENKCVHCQNGCTWCNGEPTQECEQCEEEKIAHQKSPCYTNTCTVCTETSHSYPGYEHKPTHPEAKSTHSMSTTAVPGPAAQCSHVEGPTKRGNEGSEQCMQCNGKVL